MPTLSWTERHYAGRQTCKVCGQPDKLNFHVSNRIWTAVVPRRFRKTVVCLRCFDDFAHQAQLDYAQHMEALCFAGDQATLELSVATARDTGSACLTGSCQPGDPQPGHRQEEQLSNGRRDAAEHGQSARSSGWRNGLASRTVGRRGSTWSIATRPV